jgi:phage terminase large subunit
MNISLPYNYTPREYQLPLLSALDQGYKRLVCVWHRRAGKDKTLINIIAKKMFERVGSYYYFFPTYNQGRKIIWNGMDREGFKFIHHIPQELIKRIDNSQMLIETINGSIFQVVGTDNIDSVVGTNPIGNVFSEYSLQNPRAWDFVRPILAENGGWAIFNYTPRGNNHGKALVDLAKADPAHWYCQVLTVDDTKVIPPDVLEQERLEIIKKDGNEALFQQEYYCSFDVPIQGAYYGTQLLLAEKQGRVTNVPWEPSIPVNTYWDLGINDTTAIWFEQTVGHEIRLIDYYETSGEGLSHYAKILREKPYIYGRHVGPHDIEIRELTNGVSRKETARQMGINFEVAPKLSVEEGIDATRNILAKCWFDKAKTERGLNALKSYHKVWDEENKVYKNRPEHDWSSNGSDGFRMMGVSYRPNVVDEPVPDDTKMFQGGFY